MTISPLGRPSFTIEGPYDAGGPHSLLWDGRDEGGNILTGVIGVGLLAEATLQPNSVIVLGTSPSITGLGAAPNIEVKSNPYRIFHSYDQFTQISYHIDQDALVTVKLLPPGVSDPTSPLATVLIDNQLQSALDGIGQPLDHIVDWFGHDGVDTNNILVSEEGAYTFTIEGISVLTGRTSLYRGVVQLFQ